MSSPTVQARTGPSLLLAVGSARQQGCWGPSAKRARVQNITKSKQRGTEFTPPPLLLDTLSTPTAMGNQYLESDKSDIPVVTPKPDELDQVEVPALVKKSTLPLTIDILKDLSKRRAANSHAIAARIIAQTTGSDSPSYSIEKLRGSSSRVAAAANVAQPTGEAPSTLMDSSRTILPSASLLSIETLKDMSLRRAQECKDIAARILAEGKKEKRSLENSRFPCPAKKMGPAHNRSTAFFSIPLASPHGMPLVCSHALCRKGRLKFVYCFYCNQPVSRMKFDERHAHPEQLLMALAEASAAMVSTTGTPSVDKMSSKGDGKIDSNLGALKLSSWDKIEANENNRSTIL